MERASGHFLGSIRPRPASQTFFVYANRLHDRIPREWAGVGRAAASWGSKKWALSPRIMPLFQLLWPGMPDFTGRYSSLCVNQSFARDPLGPAPHPTPLTHQPRAIPPVAAIPLKPDPTSSFRARTPHFSPTLPPPRGVSREGRSHNWRRADRNLQPEDPVGTKTN